MRTYNATDRSATSALVAEAAFRAAIDRAFEAPGREQLVIGTPAAVTLVARDLVPALRVASTCMIQDPTAPVELLNAQAEKTAVALDELGAPECAAALRTRLEPGQTWNIVVDSLERSVAAVRIRNTMIARAS